MASVTETLFERIRGFYDDSSLLWESIWGEHMHHGYYGPSGSYHLEHRLAQQRLMEELLAWAVDPADPQPQSILDVGCGIGGSSSFLAQRYDADVVGISLSPVQVQRATERAAAAQLSSQCQFEVANAMDLPFASERFDWIWSLESGEHMPNKAEFLQSLWRVLKPGGRLIFATWCHRPLYPGNGSLTPEEQRHLQAIYDVYCLPYVVGLADYETIAVDCGFTNIQTADWSSAVAPFWQQVINSVFEPKALWGLWQTGPKIIQAALSLRLMQWGYDRGLVRFGLLTAVKPSSS